MSTKRPKLSKTSKEQRRAIQPSTELAPYNEDDPYDEATKYVDLGSEFLKMHPALKRDTIKRVYGVKESTLYEYKLVNQLSHNGYSDLEIADILKVSPELIRRHKKDIKKFIAKELQNIDMNQFLGDRVSFYKNIEETAMRNVQKYKDNPHLQKHFIDLAIRAEADFHRLLSVSGFYAHRQFDPGTSGYESSDAATSMRNAISMIIQDGEFIPEVIDETLSKDDDYELL